MLEIKNARTGGEELVKELRARSAGVTREIEKTAVAVMDDVRVRGLEAVREYSLKFDGAEPYELTKDEIRKAVSECPKELYDAMKTAADNIRAYQ